MLALLGLVLAFSALLVSKPAIAQLDQTRLSECRLALERAERRASSGPPRNVGASNYFVADQCLDAVLPYESYADCVHSWPRLTEIRDRNLRDYARDMLQRECPSPRQPVFIPGLGILPPPSAPPMTR